MGQDAVCSVLQCQGIKTQVWMSVCIMPKGWICMDVRAVDACPWDDAGAWELLQHHYSQPPLQLSKPFGIRELYSFIQSL